MSQEARQAERWVFDPGAIERVCAKSLVEGLRAVADAVERGDLNGRFAGLAPWGFGCWRDTRAHFILKVHLAAHVFRAEARAPVAEIAADSRPGREDDDA